MPLYKFIKNPTPSIPKIPADSSIAFTYAKIEICLFLKFSKKKSNLFSKINQHKKIKILTDKINKIIFLIFFIGKMDYFLLRFEVWWEVNIGYFGIRLRWVWQVYLRLQICNQK